MAEEFPSPHSGILFLFYPGKLLLDRMKSTQLYNTVVYPEMKLNEFFLPVEHGKPCKTKRKKK